MRIDYDSEIALEYEEQAQTLDTITFINLKQKVNYD